jgi:putative FmdB family regulatory protein
MPIYEYECEKCGHRFEKIQKFSDPPLEACEKCGGPVHKMQSAPAFQFKGTGWYVTDYAKSGKSATEEKKPEPTKTEPAQGSTTTPTTSTTSSTSKSDSKSGD